MTGILAGGPQHGRRVATGDATTLAFPELTPAPAQSPRPPWWRFRARRRWHPRAWQPPEMSTVLYQANGETGDGLRIFWYQGRDIPPPADSKELMCALADAWATVHLADRHRPGVHWVMGRDWWTALKRTTAGPDEDEDEWEPEPGDTVLGVPITVTGSRGAPRIVTEEGPS
jgi:hypothetical protein